MSAMLQSMLKNGEGDKEEEGGLSVKERQSKLTQRLSVTYVTDSDSNAGGVKKASSFDQGNSPKPKVSKWKKVGTATKLMSALGGKKKRNTGLDFQLLPPPEETAEVAINDDAMSASASGRLESPSIPRGSRRVSVAVESRLKELAQRFHAGDDSYSNTIEEEPVITPAPTPEESALRAKKRMSANMQHNRFVEEDEGTSSKPLDVKQSVKHKLQIAKKRMSTAVLMNSFIKGTAIQPKRFQGKIKRENSLSKIVVNKLVTQKISIQEKLQLERKQEEEKRRTSIPRITRPKKSRRAGIFSNGVKLHLEEPPAIIEENPKLQDLVVVEKPTHTTQDFASGRKQERFEDLYIMGPKLGEGAFGQVFKCTHKESGQQRAVKVLHKDRMDEWEYDEVIAEFQMLTSINNPNVIRVYEFYDNDSTFYMVQELAQGGELFEELEKHKKLPEKDVALLMKNILACTQYLADKRICHRDINLENILLEEAGNYHTVKLIDFGLAKVCPQGEKLYELVGKARYLAPEVLGDEGYGLGYDVWSCGVIAAILLTGYFPFDSDSDMDVYNQIVEGAYINYDGADWVGVSDNAKSFVQQLLMFEESLRPTAKEALQHPFITNSTDNSQPTGEVWVAPKSEKKVKPDKPTKLSVPMVVDEPTPSPHDFSAGRTEQFEDIYDLGKRLGEGAFGEVYVCIHKKLKVQRAVKIIQKANMDEWEYEDVIKEFQMLTEIDNPNVIRVYEFYDTDETFYIVQELASGGELFDELEKNGKFKEADAAQLMKNVLACTDYLAQNRIVHRDINLENILLEESGNYKSVKLIDFGLATKCEEGKKLFDMVGKARYLAPEVLGNDGYGLEYDVWSCGVLAAVLLTGYFPFDSENDIEVFHQIADGAYINYDGEDWDGISSQAKNFVKRLLAFKAEDRPTAAEALNHPWIVGKTDSDKPTGEVWSAPALVEAKPTKPAQKRGSGKVVKPKTKAPKKAAPPKVAKTTPAAKKPAPAKPAIKATQVVPVVVEKASGTAEDFVSGRSGEKFEDVYTLGKRLGEGAFGEVFVCKHRKLKVERAVKIIQKANIDEWEYDDVVKEFQMLTKIKNPNVIQVYEFYDTDDTFYIVQELASGGELFDELDKVGKFKEKDAAQLMKHILGCTDYLARNQIVHRDINLENILLEASGNYETVKLIDFGLAAKVEKGQRLFDLVGKARYLAPEVLGDDGYGLGYDVWSCGILAAVLLTGYFPFDADSDMEVYQQIVDGAYINWDGSDWKGISAQAKNFVKRLLAFKAEDRPTAAEALKHPWISGNTSAAPAAGQVWISTAKNDKPAPTVPGPVRRPGGASKAPPKSTIPPSAGKKMTPAKPKTAPIKSTVVKCPAPKRPKKKVSGSSLKDKAARRIQRFFRRVKPIMVWYKKEFMYWRVNLSDVERRRKLELHDLQRLVEFEKQQIRLELELQYRGDEYEKSKRQMASANLQMAAVKKNEIRIEKQKLNQESKKVNRLRWENRVLGRGDPLTNYDFEKIRKKIQILKNARGKWTIALACLKQAKSELRHCVAEAKKKAKQKSGYHSSESDSSSSSSSGSSSSSSDSDSSISSFEQDMGDSSGLSSTKKSMTRRGNKSKSGLSKSSRSNGSSMDMSYSWQDHKSRMDASAPAASTSSRRGSGKCTGQTPKKRLSLTMDGQLVRRTDSAPRLNEEDEYEDEDKPQRRNSVGSTDMGKELKGQKRKGTKKKPEAKKKEEDQVPPLVEFGKKKDAPFSWQSHSAHTRRSEKEKKKKPKLPSNGRRASMK